MKVQAGEETSHATHVLNRDPSMTAWPLAGTDITDFHAGLNQRELGKHLQNKTRSKFRGKELFVADKQ